MVQLAQPFNPSDVPPQDNNFDPLPTGWYPAMIDETSQKATKAALKGENNDWYLNVRYTILGDKFANRKVFDMMNLQNSGPNGQQTMEIAYRQLSSICHAIGSGPISDTDEIKDKPMSIHLKMIPAKMKNGVEEYPPKNEVNGWQALDQQTAAPGTPAQTCDAAFAGRPAGPDARSSHSRGWPADP